jgi:hypothetical protein
MTREEAIDILRSYLMFDKSSMQIDIALNMAIEALSADDAPIHNDGTLEVKVPNAQKVGRVLVMDTDSHIGGGLFYPESADTVEIKPIEIKGDFHIDDDYKRPPQILGNVEVVVRCKDCRFAMVRTKEEMNKPIKPQPILCEWLCIGVENDAYCSHGERREP